MVGQFRLNSNRNLFFHAIFEELFSRHLVGVPELEPLIHGFEASAGDREFSFQLAGIGKL